MDAALQIGKFEVVTTDNGGHSAEFYAERLMDRLISVSEGAPEPIKMQALLYKDALHKVVLDTIRRAMASERSNVMYEIQKSL